ncbi:MAG TPA: phosphohistidine phosphatase SixA [Candidatus Binataceae bacterium]|nr:phosphohistidine phosphatase SixA [Candidatus Binataceae bacterium]
MILYILRHGIAEDAPPGGDDGARKLTPKGRDKMKVEAAGIKRLQIHFDAILTSPLARAAETAEIVASGLGNSNAPQVMPALATGVPPTEVVQALRPFAKHNHVMAVGHEPQLSSLASLLLTGSADGLHVDLKKGGMIAIEVGQRGNGELRFMLSARQLRRLRK